MVTMITNLAYNYNDNQKAMEDFRNTLVHMVAEKYAR